MYMSNDKKYINAYTKMVDGSKKDNINSSGGLKVDIKDISKAFLY